MTLLQCVYERKFQRSHEHATEEDLEALQYAEDAPAPAADGATATVAVVDPKEPVQQKEAEDPFQDVPVLQRTKGELYLFDTETDVFVIQEKDVDVDMASNGVFDIWIIVRKDNTPFISIPIDSEMNPRFDTANAAFMFTFRETEGLPGMTWCLRLNPAEFAEWKDKFTIYMWENKNQTSYAKAQAVEQRYIQDAYGDIEMGEEDDREAELAAQEEEEEEEEQYESAEGEDEEEEESDSEEFAKGSKNEQLAVGYKNDMSFVTRGNMIGVFAHDRDKVKFRTAIDRVKDMDGKSFNPKKIMLHNQDADMLLLDPGHSNSLFRMDLEYGKIVDEWKVSDSVNVDNIIPE